MQDAVIVSTARTPIAKAFRGSFNDTQGAGAWAAMPCAPRSSVPASSRPTIEDVMMGTAMQGGTRLTNLGRLSLLAAGLPLRSAAMTIDRQCASGLMAIAIAAKQIMVDGMAVTVGAGQEQISLVAEHPHEVNRYRLRSGRGEDGRARLHADAADRRDGGQALRHQPRSAGRLLACNRQQRTAAAQAAGLFANEIVPVTARKKLVDKETGDRYLRRRDPEPATKATARRPRWTT